MWLSRSRMLFGDAAVARLATARVAVFGVGGVGGYVVEVLARSGIGEIHLFDGDVVAESNLNRQIIALRDTLGRSKVEVTAERVQAIKPACHVVAHHIFYLPECADEVDLSGFDYVADCVDTVAAKAELVRRCQRLGVPLIVSMGAGGKFDPTAFRVGDLNQTRMDPLARALRRRLRDEGIKHVRCVWSEEPPHRASFLNDEPQARVPASNAFVPASAGVIIGGEIVKALAEVPSRSR